VEGKTIETDSGPPADWIIDRATKYRKHPYQIGEYRNASTGPQLTLSP